MDHETEREECLRCGEAPPVDDDHAYCGHCFWVVRVEIDEGMQELRKYLARWLEFRNWESA